MCEAHETRQPEPQSDGGDGALPVDRSDEWTGWKPVIILVAVLGVLPVGILAVAYIAHFF